MSELKWNYGVTTVASRRENGLLRQTVESLARAGFSEPRFFVDSPLTPAEQYSFSLAFGNKNRITYRNPTIRPMGNWWLALWELFIREPNADRYAIFQDDILCCSNLREYLEEEDFPKCGYLNLITWPSNLEKVDSKAPRGWFKAPQPGKGGQGLVFDQEAVAALLTEMRVLRRLQDEHKGHRSLDGTVRDALYNAGFSEWVHNPSLLYHLGAKGKTSMPDGRSQPLIESFLGEDYNPLTILEGSEK